MSEEKEPVSAKLFVAIALALIGFFGSYFFVDVFRQLDQQRERLRAHEIRPAHDVANTRIESAERRVQTLEGLVSGMAISIANQEQRVNQCADNLDSLSTDSKSRPDPFTGTEGAELERRIDSLEREQIKCNQKIDQLADGLKTCLTALGEKKM